MTAVFSELRRRGVLGALVAYGVAAAGFLQLADIVVHALDLPAWSLRALIGLAALGLPVTGLVSWFWDLTRHGFVRTQAPGSPSPQTPRAQAPALPAAIAQELESGALLAGRYRIEGELGKGGMGRVLAARDERLGRRVAVKVVTGAHDPARVRRFEQEARTAGALEHPNVLAVYDLGEHEGVPFLVTELLEGHTLRTLLREGGLPAAQAQNLALQLARGLAAAHARGVVHRDLKPENLFVTSDGRLKILDFGLARLTSDDPASPGLTQTGAVFGTPGYLSPEQARGEKVGPPSDVFSAGAVVYEMVAGRRAFPGASLIEAGHAAINTEPQSLPISTPPALEGVVMRSLEKEPARRFADGGQLAQALEALAAGAAIPLRAAAKSWRRSTALMVSLAALALGAAIASALRVRSSLGDVARRGPPPGASTRHVLPLVAPLPPEPPIPPEVDGKSIAREVGRQMRGAMNWGSAGVLVGARALERAGKTERAEALLRKHKDPAGELELVALWRKTGRATEADQELRAFSKTMPQRWPAPVLRAYAGQASDDEVIAAARSMGDADDAPERLTQAYYYLGILHATGPKPDLARARADFESALAQDADVPETDLASEELHSLPR